MQPPTVKVVSTLTAHQVEHLLMGGQACVFYGAAQLSRDAEIEFWLRESRSSELLIRLAGERPAVLARVAPTPPLLNLATAGANDDLARSLADEQLHEQQKDRQYCEPLRARLQELRLNRPRSS